MGLDFDSIIVLDREVQIKKSRLAGKIGECPDSIIEKIEALYELKKEQESQEPE